MSTSNLRRALGALLIAVGLLFAGPGAVGATTVPSSVPGTDATTQTTADASDTTVVRRIPRNPDEGLQAEDAREWIEDNLVFIIVGVGLVLLVVLWKWVSRPRKTTF